MKNVRIFVSESKNGALAHLARALDWQSKGDEFESRMLHKSFILLETYFAKMTGVGLCKSFVLLCSPFFFFFLSLPA